MVPIQSAAVADSAYNCLWYEHSTQFKKLLLMVILRAQNPVKMSVGKLWSVGIELFTEVLIDFIILHSLNALHSV
jgi:hypothetical protein